MKILKSIPLGCALIVFSHSVGAFSHSFNGEWDWRDAPISRTFSVDLKQHGRKLRGQYCAVAQNGNRVDCDDEENSNIEGDIDAAGQSATVSFSSFFGAKNGKAKIKMSDGRLIWHIIKNPTGGEFYAPSDAILDRH
ncbi:hypothetical protein [Paraburkholderia sp. BL10I2N1]|uniref:hypothetical protein n=1 Tax=Paraburkholderia sp. BL10I2N1 TaxID=1938796 RepID=UPI00105B6D8F|nr:hypothetical protein [Paraburkholderia sp. BL10I2N1]TDN69139.1 hypothetical protein B0G77_2511 [Paraburkholderia sp. BL10I2N1]